jgi:hypothetical protein
LIGTQATPSATPNGGGRIEDEDEDEDEDGSTPSDDVGSGSGEETYQLDEAVRRSEQKQSTSAAAAKRFAALLKARPGDYHRVDFRSLHSHEGARAEAASAAPSKGGTASHPYGGAVDRSSLHFRYAALRSDEETARQLSKHAIEQIGVRQVVNGDVARAGLLLQAERAQAQAAAAWASLAALPGGDDDEPRRTMLAEASESYERVRAENSRLRCIAGKTAQNPSQ